MPNKKWNELNEIDRQLRSLSKTGPDALHGTQITIELIQGFELFNTRAYHNYETWSTGYRITGFGCVVEYEDLDEAVVAFAKHVKGKEGDR